MKRSGDAFRDSLLDAIGDNAIARLRILSRLAEWGGQAIYLPTVSTREARLLAARKMLMSKMDRSSVADAIRKRFGCSLRTAQRSVKTVEELSEHGVASVMSNGDSSITPHKGQ